VGAVELVGFLEGHPEEAAGDGVPERRAAFLVHDSAKLGDHALGEALPVELDEEIAASRQQHPEPAGALAGMEEEAAHL
jgi:hypothetical protein